MRRVIVIGGGASGMMAAIKAAEKSEVVLLETNDKCGKKLLVTGNGKCNYWNDDISLKNYFTNEKDYLNKILNNQHEVLEFLYKLGLYPKVKNGYYYPYSNQASSVREILEKELLRRGVKILYNSKVLDIDKAMGKFKVSLESDVLEADNVIIATGSKAAPKTGSDGDGYKWVQKFGHQIKPVLPALTFLRADEFFLKEWNGIRQDARLSLFVDGKFVASEEGEAQLTQDGISGICTFNLSSIASRALYNKQEVTVSINFVPFLNENFYTFFDKRASLISDQTLEELLESILNYKLISVVLKKANLAKNLYWKSLTENEKKALCESIENLKIKIIGTGSCDKSQVCTGGVALDEIDCNMQSKICDGLYLVGELLDVDGKCGGFNLVFAFISGYIAGKSI